jgi:PAS domain S-box-containing protein
MTPRGLDPQLWTRLAEHAEARAKGAEPAHDFFHVTRVVTNALTIARAERADEAICAVAALLHELYTLPKSHPESSSAGDVCAEHARELLVAEQLPAAMIEPVCAAIRDHSFSKGVVPDALESKVLQDADRLDALGAIGLARMWATCADMKRPFYSPDDPFCTTRRPDDKSWGLDHVYKKLLVVPERLHLVTSKILAQDRVTFIRTFVGQLDSEITGSKKAPAIQSGLFARIVDDAPDGILVSRNGMVLYANHAASLLLGHEAPASLVGQTMATFLDEDSLVAMRRRIEQVQTGGTAVPREYPAMRRDGVRIVAEIVSTVVEFDGETAMLAFARDVTERSQLQSQLAHSDRLAAMGVIAAGVAHEINNPLGFIRLATEVFERKLSGTGAATELVALARDLREGVDRIGSIVQDLRVFGRYEDEPLAPVDPVAALDAASRLVSHEIVPRARLLREIDGGLPPVLGVAGRLEQVFVNLLLNAGFAFPDNGTLGEIVVTGRATDTTVIFEVTDNGPGMAPEVLQHIFEPFFSMKRAGGGTGLGLSICRGIVERTGGKLTARSEVGEGTTMRVVLPRALAEVVSEPASAPRTPVSTRRLDVLVVDDEKLIVDLVRRLLEGKHAVVGETDARRALALLLTEKAHFDVVLCDLMMPELTGMDLYEEVVRVRPELASRFVFITGGSYTDRTSNFLGSVKTRLMKPFSASSLSQAIAEVAKNL